MKKFLKMMLCITGPLLVLIVLAWLCISYTANKKTTCDTSVSLDGKYELMLQAVGEPDWPFGSASGRLVLTEGQDKISQTDFELHNDGGNITSNCWKVTWYEDYVEVILSGEEQFDEQVILYFDGTKEIQQLTDIVKMEADYPSGVKMDYGTSSIYSKADMDAAIKIIMKEFEAFEGCELHSLSYVSDEKCNTAENIAWMNQCKATDDPEVFTQCIAFDSNFHSPMMDSGAWNPDEEYTDWEWWLARSDGGEWKLMTYGY
ncbi:hypothetical protein LI187_13810 [bacterium 210820-DFI.6.38]|nr:hypothetical protein [bacterium 210820-DFI.6.38]